MIGPTAPSRGDSHSVLSSRPSSPWPGGVLHHGARAGLLLLVAVLVTLFFPPEARERVTRLEVGDVAESAVVALIPFTVPKRPEELAREQTEVRASVPPTFNFRPEAGDSMAARVDRFFASLDSVASLDDPAPLLTFLAERSIEPTETQQALLRDREMTRALAAAAVRAAQTVVPRGVAEGADLENLTTSTLVVRDPDGQDRTVSRSAVLSPPEFYERGVELLPSEIPDLQQLLRLILIQNMEHSFELNALATELDGAAAARAVPTSKRDVQTGESIVGSNTQITAREAEVLEAYTAALTAAALIEDPGVEWAPYLGAGLLNLMILAVFGVLLFVYRIEIYSNFRWVILIALLIVSYAGVGAFIARQALPTEFLPIAFVALAVAVLWEGRLALVLVTILVALTAVQQPFVGPEVLATTLAGGAAAALSVRAVRRRAQTWVFIAIITGAYTVALLALALTYGGDPGALGVSWLAAASNAALSAILAMGFVPVFEVFTGITTDQTLLEWADPNRPLLRRLSMEAPGTYAHTINVANLAEAAANAIGANGLLCRVGLYYHDVGKMLKPLYFVENQPQGRNPHDHLNPEVSAAIVKEHVVEGFRLAREAKVPDVVAAFIPEHHGTQRIGYFWEKAKEAYGADELNVEDFTYPGPKPQSRETALALLADSVESATRALQDPTPERVRDLIENIVESKISHGQLDEAPLTLREIRQIKEQFIKALSGIYHHRIDYPQTRHLTEAAPTGSSGEAKTAAEGGAVRSAGEAGRKRGGTPG